MAKRIGLVSARMKAGFNQRELARALGVNAVYLCRIENGLQKGSYDFWRRVRGVLGFSAEEVDAIIDEGVK